MTWGFELRPGKGGGDGWMGTCRDEVAGGIVEEDESWVWECRR
jgi:hypothetical protein